MESKSKPIRTWKLLEYDKLRSYTLTLLRMLWELFFHLRYNLFLKSALFLPKICVDKLPQTELEMEDLARKASGLKFLALKNARNIAKSMGKAIEYI